MSKVKSSQIQDIESNISSLNNKIIPNIRETYRLMREFHKQEVNDFNQIVANIEDVEESLREKQEQCESCINQIASKRKQQDKLGQISVGVLEAKSEEIKSKVKNIDAVSTGIKQTVGKIKPKKLQKLPVNDESQRMLNSLFTTIYETLYAEQSEKFDWNRFSKLALKHEDGEDFIFRLVNVNFKDLSSDKYDKLLKLKTDPEFEHCSVNSKYAEDIIDLADWVEYVCLGHQFSLEKKKAEKQYEKIRRDIDKKSKQSLNMSEKFWKEASSEIQKFQTQIQSINSQLKAISFGMNKSIEECNQLDQKRHERIEELKKIAANN